MKNKLIPALLLLSISFNGWSQSVNLDRRQFDVAYVKLPEAPIPEDSKRTFSVHSLNATGLTYSLSKYYFESEIKIPGFTKFNEDAFLTVTAKLQDIVITSKKVDKRTSSSKKKDGTVITTNYYTGVVEYTTQGTVTITSADGSINEHINFNDQKSISGDESTSYKTAANFRNKNHKSTLRTKFLDNAIRVVNRFLSRLYGYPKQKYKDHLWILDSRKHPENTNHNQHYESVKSAFSKMSAEEPVIAVKTEVMPAIRYFESIISKYPGKDRKSRKIKYASYYNLATLYYYLDDHEKCTEYAEKLILNDFDERHGKNLKEKAAALKAKFTNNKLNTRHFNVVTEDKTNYFDTAAQKNVVEVQAKLSPSENPDYSLSYLITKNSDTVSGYINMMKVAKLRDHVQVFIRDMEGKEIARSFKAYEIDVLLLGNGERYTTIAFKPSQSAVSIASGDHKAYFVKEIYTSGKLGLYEFQKNELIIKKSEAKNGQSTASAGWMLGFRKKLRKLAEDCPVLAERAKNREFSNNAQSLTAFIKAYENCD